MFGNSVAAIRQFTPPVLREGKEVFIEFYAFSPADGKMKRKRIKLGRIKGVKARREYAKGVIERLIFKLQNGWNPWLEQDLGELHTTEDILTKYSNYIDNMYNRGYYRKETYDAYRSKLKQFCLYVEKNPIYYLYQMNRLYLTQFLDFVFLERGNSAQTRNNYLNWLNAFFGWCVDKGYLTSRPTEGIAYIDKRHIQKQREVIPPDIVKQISEWVRANDPYFAFACYLLYNCFIRPVEMTRLKLGDINIVRGTIVIRADASKNRRTMTVTLPHRVLQYAIDLGIFQQGADSDYIFSTQLKPGPTQIDPKIFRDHWAKVRKALSLKSAWQFYSLKDTGISEMLESKIASISVRDQARHSSLAITEIYTRHLSSANPELADWEGSF